MCHFWSTPSVFDDCTLEAKVRLACINAEVTDAIDTTIIRFELHSGVDMDSSRNQNSFIFTSKHSFKPGSFKEVTKMILAALDDVHLSKGDLLALEGEHVDGDLYLLVSFHGDTQGLASLPVIRALHKVVQVRACVDVEVSSIFLIVCAEIA